MTSPPLISIILFSYNQENYIREAVEAVLAQSYSPLEIILSDDCSTDRTFEIMQETVEAISDCPHEVIVRQTPVNLGLGAHFDQLTTLARGEIVIAAGGDDVSLPERASVIYEQGFQNHPEVDVVCSGFEYIGARQGKASAEPRTSMAALLDDHATFLYHGCTGAYRKRLLQAGRGCVHPAVAEDLTLGMRSLFLGREIHHIDQELVKYRVHADNLSQGKNAKAFSARVLTTYSLIRDESRMLQPEIRQSYGNETATRLDELLSANLFRVLWSSIARKSGFLNQTLRLLIKCKTGKQREGE